jgi:hypothetical protein
VSERATTSALEAFREPLPEGTPGVGLRVGRETMEGALGTLSSPQGLERLATIMDATITRSLEAALRDPAAGLPGRRGGHPRALSFVGRIARDSGTAFGDAFALELRSALGPDGRGPLAESLRATTAQVSGSAVAGARGELEDLFPACTDVDRQACVERQVRSLGRAAAAGFVDGIVRSAVPAVAIAFLLGVLVTLGVRAIWRLLHHPPPAAPREAHP